VRGAPPVAIISHGLWLRRFGGDPDAVGRTLNIGGVPVPVIGVMPPHFETPRGDSADIWRPSQIFPIPPEFATMSTFITIFGRLKPGVTPQQAEVAVAPLILEDARLLRRGPLDDYRPRVRSLRDYQVGDASRAAWLLLGAVAGLLLIACVNVTNLILARLAAREREFAVRAALGAGRWRLARLALMESLLLSAAAGALGLAIAAGLLRLFVSLAPSSIFKLNEASLDLRVFAVAAILSAIAGAAIGIWPAISVLRTATLQHGARVTVARPRLRFALVTRSDRADRRDAGQFGAVAALAMEPGQRAAGFSKRPRCHDERDVDGRALYAKSRTARIPRSTARPHPSLTGYRRCHVE